MLLPKYQVSCGGGPFRVSRHVSSGNDGSATEKKHFELLWFLAQFSNIIIKRLIEYKSPFQVHCNVYITNRRRQEAETVGRSIKVRGERAVLFCPPEYL